MKAIALVISLVAATLLLRYMVGADIDSRPSPTVEVTEDSPIAWKLGSIDAGTRTVPIVLAKEWEWQFDRLLRKAIDAPSRTKVSDVVVACSRIIKHGGGPDLDLLSIARAIDASIPADGVSFTDFDRIATVTCAREISAKPLLVKDRTAKRAREGFRRE